MLFIKFLIVEEQCNMKKTYNYNSAALFIPFISKHCMSNSSDDNQHKLWLTLQKTY